jgi:hypothetical protein
LPVTCTLVFGTTAADGSVTSPRIEPGAWAYPFFGASADPASRVAKTAKNLIQRFFICSCVVAPRKDEAAIRLLLVTTYVERD